MVGPLPATNITKLQPLTHPFNNQHPGKTIIPSLTLPGQNVQAAILQLGSDIEDITKELWNTVRVICAKSWNALTRQKDYC